MEAENLDRPRCVGERMSSKGTTTDKKSKGHFFGEWRKISKGTFCRIEHGIKGHFLENE
jgi:hypothetical protein